MLEDLREICIYKEAFKTLEGRNTWYNYIGRVHNQCYGAVSESCSQLAHKLAGVDYQKTKKCVDDSFSADRRTSNNWKDKDIINHIIEKEMEEYAKYKTNHFPTVVINNQTFRGQLEIEAVMNGICAGFLNPPKMCHRLLESNNYEDSRLIFLEDDEVSLPKVVFICGCIIFAVALILCIYRRHVRR